jgi:hypothetical protein
MYHSRKKYTNSTVNTPTLAAFWKDGQRDNILVASGPLIYNGRTERESILKQIKGIFSHVNLRNA